MDWLKELLKAAGIEETKIDGIIADFNKESVKYLIPKDKYNEVAESKKNLEKDIAARDTQLEELKSAAGASDDLKAQIAQLQTDNQTAADKHAIELKELTTSNAIKLALTGKVHEGYEDIITGLFDKEKLVVDGEKVIGLDEQLAGLKEARAQLFIADTPPGTDPLPGFKVGADGKHVPADPKPASLQDAIAARFAANTQ